MPSPSRFSALRKLKIKMGRNACRPGMHSNNIMGEIIVINKSIHTRFPSHLDTLTLSGLTLFPCLSVWSDSTATTLKSLRTLELNFVFEGDERVMIQYLQLIDSKGFTGPKSWLLCQSASTSTGVRRI